MSHFLFNHKKSPEQGFLVILHFERWWCCGWLGYGKPIWWKPRFIGKGVFRYGFGFGWMLLCFRVVVSERKSEQEREVRDGV